MKVGIPKEIKQGESRVGMTPAGVSEFVKRGHTVYVQHTAGDGSGFPDKEYEEAGASILPTMEEVYAASDMIVKVKEPIAPEYPLIRKDQIVFTYFHFACERELTDAMLKSGAVCIAYETVQKADRSLPLLIPMSEVAGRMATLNGAYYLQKTKGGKGKLISAVPGVEPARVLVLGGGTVGEAAARVQVSSSPTSICHACVSSAWSCHPMSTPFIPPNTISASFCRWSILWLVRCSFREPSARI